MNNPDHISESLETIFWVKIPKFFDPDPGSGMEKIRIRGKHARIRNTEEKNDFWVLSFIDKSLGLSAETLIII
jgi:hypothetical protein